MLMKLLCLCKVWKLINAKKTLDESLFKHYQCPFCCKTLLKLHAHKSKKIKPYGSYIYA